MTVNQKIFVAFCLFLTWGLCAYDDPALRPAFISAIHDALVGLGVFAATLQNPKE